MRIILFVLLSFCLFSGIAQSPIETSLTRYKNILIPEKVFIHTDKDIYAVGERVWMAVYLMDGLTHQPGTVSKLIKIELRNNKAKVVLSQNLFSNNGHSNGDLLLSSDIAPGDYHIVGYTNFQLNSGSEFLFRKKIKILPGINEELNNAQLLSYEVDEITANSLKNTIRFFPEGGDCISGIPCRMAFEIKTSEGEALAAKGDLINSKGIKVLTISSDQNGIGRFKYLPHIEEEYFIQFDSETQKIKVPQPLVEGYHLSVTSLRDTMKIFSKTNLSKGMKDVRITLHLRGNLLLDRKINHDKPFNWLKIPTSSFDPGIVVCTMFDDQNIPVAERLFFIPPSETETEIEIELKENLSIREANEIQLSISKSNNESISLDSSRISLSILPSLFHSPKSNEDIRTWIYLNSDLNEPVQFNFKNIFGKNKTEIAKEIDKQMMTRGWRRFRWKSMLNNEKIGLSYKVEEGVFISGRMGVYEKPKKARPGKIFITQPESMLSEEKLTDKNGYFEFGPYGFYDTLDVYIEGRYKAGRKNRLNPKISRKNNAYVFLELLEKKTPELPLFNFFTNKIIDEKKLAAYVELSKEKLTIARNYDSLSILLNEVEVKTKRISPEEQERRERTLIYTTPSNRLVVKDLPGGRMARTVFDLLRRIPGVTVIGFGEQENARIRGVGSLTGQVTPVYFLDGVPVEVGIIRSLPVENIDFVDVLKTGKAAILGSRAARGAILIYTKTGSTLSQGPIVGMLKTKLVGFYRAKEFSVFDTTDENNSNRPDIRTTIHWNPDLRTNQEGRVIEKFTTSDQTGSFIIIAQGLRKDGTPLYGIKEFKVEED